MKATRLCEVDGCGNGGRIVRGYCPMHYARVKRHGDPGAADKQHAVSYAGRNCLVEDCGKVPKSLGYCIAHYKKFRKYGDPLDGHKAREYSESFEMYVQRGPGCWQWDGTIYSSGYGKINAEGTSMLAHRWSYEQHKGPIPEGLVIDHLCRNRACVNPDHLEAVTNEENLRRGAGYALQNGMRTTCINGHEYNEDTTYHDPQGGVRCRACARLRDTQRRAA